MAVDGRKKAQKAPKENGGTETVITHPVKGSEVLKEKGFTDEAFLLEHVAVFRGNDNWLNASVEKESAYAATNFPFEIVTIYPDFFKYPKDDIERAAILLHESKHLEGKDEKVTTE